MDHLYDDAAAELAVAWVGTEPLRCVRVELAEESTGSVRVLALSVDAALGLADALAEVVAS